jgi:hypothetical protein
VRVFHSVDHSSHGFSLGVFDLREGLLAGIDIRA